MTQGPPTIVTLLADRVLDDELAALLWLLSSSRMPIHVAAPDREIAGDVAAAIVSVAANPALVTAGSGTALEDVLRLPVPLRPATGAVVVLDGRRVAAAHLLRPPLRDAGGHVRPQPPAVLAARDARADRWEHFAWALAPEIGEATGQRPGDVEIDLARRRELLEALVATRADPDRVRAALAAYAASRAVE